MIVFLTTVLHLKGLSWELPQLLETGELLTSTGAPLSHASGLWICSSYYSLYFSCSQCQFWFDVQSSAYISYCFDRADMNWLQLPPELLLLRNELRLTTTKLIINIIVIKGKLAIPVPIVGLLQSKALWKIKREFVYLDFWIICTLGYVHFMVFEPR